jgi:hypothetical protein
MADEFEIQNIFIFRIETDHYLIYLKKIRKLYVIKYNISSIIYVRKDGDREWVIDKRLVDGDSDDCFLLLSPPQKDRYRCKFRLMTS